MKTVVITGSARGFGYAMMEQFRKNNYNCVLCDVDSNELVKAKKKLLLISSKGKVLSFKMDVTDPKSILNVINKTLVECKKIDIWINNAGINQPNKPIWDLDISEIDKLINVDLKGTITCSKLIMETFIKQKDGAIYNVEGYGSNDKCMLGLSIYGTAKRAVTYFTEALGKEVETKKLNIRIGKISPGIMITNFIDTPLGNKEKMSLDLKTKKVYNILGDYPEDIANYVVKKIIINDKNNVKITWLTNRKAFFRFFTAFLRKNKFFEEE